MSEITAGLTQNEMCVAVAKDVLKHLNELTVRRNAYCRPIYDYESLECAIKGMETSKGAKLDDKEFADQLTINCEVCALGACLISKLRLFDQVEHQIFYTDSIVLEGLNDVFTLRQMGLIEAAFELDIDSPILYGPGTPEDLTIDDLQAAVKFGREYASASERLRAIMENIITNEGVFKP